MNQKFRFTAEPRSALCLLSMALMLLSAAARLWYYLADPVATAMTLSQADIFLLVGLPVFSAALYPVLLALFGRRGPFCSVFSLRPCVGSNAELGRAAVLAVRLLPPVLVGAALWFALARVPLVWFWPAAMACFGCLSAALGMVYDVVRVLQVPGRATFCDLGIVIQVYREVS